MTVQSVTGTHVTGGNAFASTGVVDTTEIFFYYYVALHKELNFYILNNDATITVSWRVLGMHKAHNFQGVKATLPTDVIVTEVLAAAPVTATNFSAIQAIDDLEGYSHIVIGLDAASTSVDDVSVFGWGRLRGA